MEKNELNEVKKFVISNLCSFLKKCGKDIPDNIEDIEKISIKLDYPEYDKDSYLDIDINYEEISNNLNGIQNSFPSHPSHYEHLYYKILDTMVSTTEKIAFIIGAGADIQYVPMGFSLDKSSKKIKTRNLEKRKIAFGCLFYGCSILNQNICAFINKRDACVFSTNWSRNIISDKIIYYSEKHSIKYYKRKKTLKIFFGGGKKVGSTEWKEIMKNILKSNILVYIGTSIPTRTISRDIINGITDRTTIQERPIMIYLQNSLISMPIETAIPKALTYWGPCIVFFDDIIDLFY